MLLLFVSPPDRSAKVMVSMKKRAANPTLRARAFRKNMKVKIAQIPKAYIKIGISKSNCRNDKA